VVSDHQLSLAIGKNGQNVRLAAKLTGWKIDIMGESEYEKERAQERAEEIEEAIAHEHRAQAEAEAKQKARDAERAAAEGAPGPSDEGPEGAKKEDRPFDLPGVGKKLLEALTAGGFDSIEKIAAATKEQLMELPKIGEKTAEKILSAARESLQGHGKEAESPSSPGDSTE
jgi:DNA uptake protein ComE-like DNA-binding protein